MPNTGSSSMRLRIWSNPLRRTSRSDVQDWKVQVVLVAACKTDSRKATNNLEGDKLNHSAGLMASLALPIPAFAQTSPPPATQEPAMQDQSTPAPAAKQKAKTTAHTKKAKGKHVNAKPRHQLTIRLLRDRGPRAISLNVTERAIGLAFAHHPSTCLSPSGGNLEAYAWSARILPGRALTEWRALAA